MQRPVAKSDRGLAEDISDKADIKGESFVDDLVSYLLILYQGDA
jgi:hypothetical protein